MRHRLALVFLMAVILFNATFSVITLSLPQYAETKVYAAGEEFALQWNRNNGAAIQKAIRTGDGLESALQGTRLLAKGGWYGNSDPVAFTTFHTLECETGEYNGSAQTGNPFDAGPNWCVDAWKSNHREVQFIGPSYWCVKQDNGSWLKQKSGAGPVKKGATYNMTPENYEITPSVIVVLNEKDFGSTPTYGYYAQVTHVRHDNQHGTDQKGNIKELSRWDAPDYGGGKNRGMDDWNGHDDNKPPDSCINPPFRKTIGNDAPPLITSPGVYNLQSPKYANDKPFLKKWGLSPETLNTTTNSNNTSSVTLPGLQCNFGLFDNPLAWLICPVIQGLVEIANTIDNLIISQLSVGSDGTSGDPSQIFCSEGSKGKGIETCKAYKGAWLVFRNFALGLLAIVGLIVIISQIVDLEIFSAYTVKKILPRLIIAAIAIALSWQLMQFFVTLTNDVGLATRNLIYVPFKTFLAEGGINTKGAMATLFAAGGGILALGVFGALSFGLTAALAAIVAFFTLVLRQLLIILLIILSPIAIVAYVLPNTERIYKMWWENFSKALLMFPLIIAMIAAGKVFASVALYGGGGPVTTFIAFAAYFGPYFMLPATFKFAGGMLSAASGAVNRAAAGGFQGLSGFRSNRFKQRRANAAERATKGAIFRQAPQGSLRSRINSGVQSTAHLGKMGVNPAGWRGNIAAAKSRTNQNVVAEAREKSAEFRSVMNDDRLLEAAMAGRGTNADARRHLMANGYTGNIDQAVGAISQARKDLGAHNFYSAASIANAGTGTGYKGGQGHMLDAIARASGNDEQLRASMLNQANGLARQAKRTDLSEGGFGTKMTLMDDISNATTEAERQAAITAANDEMADEIVATTSAGALAGSKNQAVQNLAPAYVRRMENARIAQDSAHAELVAMDQHGIPHDSAAYIQAQEHYAATQRQYIQAAAKTASVIDVMGQDNPDNATTLADEVMSHTIAIPGEGRQTTIRNEMLRLQSDPVYNQIRRELTAQEGLHREATTLPTQTEVP